MTHAANPIDVWILVFPNFLLLDATGPAQVFASANDEAVDAGLAPPYRVRIAAPGGRRRTSLEREVSACALGWDLGARPRAG